MSKNLKDLIDGVEQEEMSRSQLEKEIEILITENRKLQTKLDELKPKSLLKTKLQKSVVEDSEEIKILKNLISSQKNEILKKDGKIKNFQQKIDELDKYILKLKNEIESHDSKIVEQTQKSMENLLNEYQRIETLNTDLQQKITEFKNDKNLVMQKTQKEKEELEGVISEFEIENKRLKDEINNLTMKQEVIRNIEIENENLNNLNLNLEKEIEHLKKEKKEIKDKDAVLLAKTITAMNVHEKPQLPPKTNETEKVAELDIFTENAEEPPKEVILPKPHKNIEELIAEEISEGNNQEIIKRKWECPDCGNTNKAQIREIPDKTRIIYAGPGGNMYAKKYKCGLCATEWH
jgi:chromosome segregation ATPase